MMALSRGVYDFFLLYVFIKAPPLEMYLVQSKERQLNIFTPRNNRCNNSQSSKKKIFGYSDPGSNYLCVLPQTSPKG